MTFYDVPYGGIWSVYQDLLDMGGEGYQTHYD